MSKWSIRLSDVVDYHIEAETKDEAIKQALEMWRERTPLIEPEDCYITKQDIWETILEDVCGCYEDEVGNRACDWGATCDRCQASWVQDIYQNELRKKGLAD